MIMVYFAYLIIDEKIDDIVNGLNGIMYEEQKIIVIDDRDLAFAFSCSFAFSLEGKRPVFFLCWLSRTSHPV